MAERLWAPWRLRYIEGSDAQPKIPGCIFVELPKLEDDRTNLILHRGTTAFVIMNRYPYTNGHLMVAPFQHTSQFSDLSDAELLEINQLVQSCIRWIDAVYSPQGYNIGVNIGAAGGAGIPDHLHWHIVPRWSGDTNFMTTCGDTRVMPQSLDDSYDRLKAVNDL